jgi:hypothetical protein
MSSKSSAKQLLAGTWLVAVGLAAAGLSAVSAPCYAAAPADSIYWIDLERGDSLEARSVEIAWGDFVRYRRPDGTAGYVSANRVAHIYGASGSDYRDLVLKHSQTIGTRDGAWLSRKESHHESVQSGPRYHSFAFRGGDKSHCASFMLTEAGILIPLKADAGTAGDQKLYGSIDLGWMKNVGQRSAVGVSGFWESGSDHNRGGVRLRYRRWLDDHLSLELSPGIVTGGNDTYNPPGFIGQVAINAGDLMSVVLEGEVDQYASNGSSSSAFPGATQYRSDTTFRLGLRGGSYVGVGVSLLAGIGLAAIAASFGGI